MPSIKSSRDSGRAAEHLARNHLQQHGLRLLAQNWTCRGGELDLVMLDGDTVVFVEVRYRKHAAWGGALESVDGRKRQRLVLAAELFLQRESRWGGQPCRFDVVAIGPGDTGLNWLRNAFET
ncbi:MULTISPECIES: YraN family protein [unclassified Pseudomonas]|uniref:YraN family protein n=1 Tax=unclassified Pseudomonas TaxID=196821 RepID=UPI002447ADC1|nr:MULTISPECIES: YraN family protein [unclassified Pseudomonas]MDG9929894.1 YraN family protein [Pseudomonas sp. GD04042]MDH0485055.1 YraN family protein [Pseudomonas sp. GD04015]MDH0606381.1 YraN family protein [Pseudomonas sp. GD03869]